MAAPTFLQPVVAFLRKGYPEGVPEQDYLPLFALLRRQLSDDEVRQVADELLAGGGATHRAAIEATIREFTSVAPAEADVDRVRARLAAGGWPLQPPGELPRA